MKYIFGAGLVGLLAKHILPGDWTIIPFGKSRFFSFNPPIDDDYIIRDDRIEDVISGMCPNKQVLMRKRAWSLGGQLFQGYDKNCAEEWLNKIFGYEYPGHSHAYLMHHMAFASYNVNLSNLYQCLAKKYEGAIDDGKKIGKVTELGKNYFIAGGKRYDFTDLVSTIPLYAAYDLAKIEHSLRTINCQALQLTSKKIDLEGNDQVFVADLGLAFYKVTKLLDGSYIFYFNAEMPQPARYLMNVLDDFRIINGTTIDKYIPVGEDDLSRIKGLGVTPIGSYAEWDWYCDIGTNILRLLNLGKYKA